MTGQIHLPGQHKIRDVTGISANTCIIESYEDPRYSWKITDVINDEIYAMRRDAVQCKWVSSPQLIGYVIKR